MRYGSLRYYPEPHVVRGPSSVRREYLAWRSEHGRPYQCDNDQCHLHTPNPHWNGEPVILEVDHIDGVAANSDPFNLRLLCPNCHSQQPTSGNRRRVIDKRTDGYTVTFGALGWKTEVDTVARLHFYTVTARAGEYNLGGVSAATVTGVTIDREKDDDQASGGP